MNSFLAAVILGGAFTFPLRVDAANDTTLLPLLGMQRDAVHARLAAIKRLNNGNTPAYEIYLMHDKDGTPAYVHVGYYRDHNGRERVAEVKLDGGPTASPLSAAWKSAFNRRFNYDSAEVPTSALPESVRKDAAISGTETVSFHRYHALAQLENSWHNDGGTWKRGACPDISPTLVMIYSDDPRSNIEIYSEFMETCYQAII
jgi:hypothetical protein